MYSVLMNKRGTVVGREWCGSTIVILATFSVIPSSVVLELKEEQLGRKRKGHALNAEQRVVDQLFELPTPERFQRAEGNFTQTGATRSSRRYQMKDDNLGRLVIRKTITEQQFAALQRYAIHWYSAGLAGALSSFDLDRIRAMNPASMGGLARSERELTHKRIYHDARLAIGADVAYVADMVACHDYPLAAAAVVLGYASPYRGRLKAGELLAQAGDRLDQFWQSRDKGKY